MTAHFTPDAREGRGMIAGDRGPAMRVLVTWGTRLGGTEGIARIIGEALEHHGFDVTLAPASEVPEVSGYDAAVVGGALYVNRWHRDARRFVDHNVDALRRIPVWLFSSGPLDESAERHEIPPTKQVEVLMERIGAVGHVTFGGRLASDARRFPASVMARTISGDFRNPDRIRIWAGDLARALPTAHPSPAVKQRGRSPWRVVVHGVVGWGVCAATLIGLLRVASTGVATALHAVLAPLIFAVVAVHYFRARGARSALPTAAAFTAIVAVLDVGLIAGLILHSFATFGSFAVTWLPMVFIFLATWITGIVMSTLAEGEPTDTTPGIPGTRMQSRA